MKALYRWHVDYGRMGDLEGLFVAEDYDLQAALGKTVYLGEVLGKHSEVTFTLEPRLVTRVTDDPDFIQRAEDMGIVPIGADLLGSIYTDEED